MRSKAENTDVRSTASFHTGQSSTYGCVVRTTFDPFGVPLSRTTAKADCIRAVSQQIATTIFGLISRGVQPIRVLLSVLGDLRPYCLAATFAASNPRFARPGLNPGQPGDIKGPVPGLGSDRVRTKAFGAPGAQLTQRGALAKAATDVDHARRIRAWLLICCVISGSKSRACRQSRTWRPVPLKPIYFSGRLRQ